MVEEITKDTIWDLLKEISDPEIPVISIVELGIVRNIGYINKLFHITITPTYSGCPAISYIKEEIIRKMNTVGISNYKLHTSLSPPWTTDWMSNETKTKLKEVGISPPSKTVQCPQCNSIKVEVISEFGSTACKALYKCISCKEPFHHFKQF